MIKGAKTRELFKCTMQQYAIQCMLKAYSQDVDRLDLGPRLKLGDRGNNILLDLIKSKDLKEVNFADCKLRHEELFQIKQVLTDETTTIVFRNSLNIGIEGCALIKALLRRKQVDSLTIWDCGFTLTQLTMIVDSLIKMTGTVIEELNLRGTNIGQDGAILLKRLLLEKQVKKMDLGHCFLSTSHLECIIEGVSNMTGTMDVISLRGNLISRTDVDQFKLQTENKVIEVLFY
uniref:Uncharacterized protein LOC100177463 n=1 Tax=Phallusia mammillata TaxID=59560 RepID=A0A6F9DHE9_9ASCI|nr:uncharacterized protein LOC100177463 [Phallusia mammillata]